MKEEKKKTLIVFKLGKDETLRCDSCFKYLHDQKVHLCIFNVDGAGYNQVICDACWKEDQKEIDE